METRAAFLPDPVYRMVFHCTPKHASWMNQIEIWLSILARNPLERGSFTSVAVLKAKVLTFVDYFNRTVARLSLTCFAYAVSLLSTPVVPSAEVDPESLAHSLPSLSLPAHLCPTYTACISPNMTAFALQFLLRV
jgi:hypothetical protein